MRPSTSTSWAVSRASGGAAGRHVDVASADLGDVHSRDVAQQVAEIVCRDLLDLLGLEDTHGRGDLVQLLFRPGGGDDDHLGDFLHRLVLGDQW